jgi:hypothetical protein
MEGKEVHAWNLVGLPVLMLPGGSLMGTRHYLPGHGGLYEDNLELVQVDWNSTREWSFSEWDDGSGGGTRARQHHDLQREGNPVGYFAPGQGAKHEGRTLVLGHKNRHVPAVTTKELLDDVIYEVDPAGSLTGFVWYAADHIGEMGFDAVARAAIADDPRWSEGQVPVNWLHVNSMAALGRNRWYEQEGDARFHPDNIIFSSRDANFIAIISRDSGYIVWRVGPDMGPGTPGQELGQLVGQHHAHMIPHGLPGAGNILVFDNGGYSGYGGPEGFPKHGRLWSRVLEFDPVTLKKVWQYGSPGGPDAFASFYASSAQRLPNGNTLITNTLDNDLLEVARDGRVVWRIETTVIGDQPLVYRTYRVPPEWLPGGFNPANYDRWDKLFENGM